MLGAFPRDCAEGRMRNGEGSLWGGEKSRENRGCEHGESQGCHPLFRGRELSGLPHYDLSEIALKGSFLP